GRERERERKLHTSAAARTQAPGTRGDTRRRRCIGSCTPATPGTSHVVGLPSTAIHGGQLLLLRLQVVHLRLRSSRSSSVLASAVAGCPGIPSSPRTRRTNHHRHATSVPRSDDRAPTAPQKYADEEGEDGNTVRLRNSETRSCGRRERFDKRRSKLGFRGEEGKRKCCKDDLVLYPQYCIAIRISTAQYRFLNELNTVLTTFNRDILDREQIWIHLTRLPALYE
ncbi:hypothetical protein ALC56_13576, partial [Trachymyrmex septentrionalis]